MKILNIGSLNYDYVYPIKHIVRPGETIASLKMETFCGGKGLNQSVALARAGAFVYHAGLIGEDGDLLLDTCKNNQIDVRHIKKIQERSGHTIIQVDKEGQNCILLYGGSNRFLTSKYVDQVLNCFEQGDWLLLQNEVNMLSSIIDKAYQRGLHIALNPSPFDGAVRECDLSKITLFLLNEIEGEQITGLSNEKEILDAMVKQYPMAQIVLTLGSKGVIYRDKDKECYQGIFRVKAVDTTAAGDTFTGYFLNALVNNLSVEEALKLSSKASAIAVARPGAAASIPYRKEVEEYKFESLD